MCYRKQFNSLPGWYILEAAERESKRKRERITGFSGDVCSESVCNGHGQFSIHALFLLTPILSGPQNFQFFSYILTRIGHMPLFFCLISPHSYCFWTLGWGGVNLFWSLHLVMHGPVHRWIWLTNWAIEVSTVHFIFRFTWGFEYLKFMFYRRVELWYNYGIYYSCI